MHSDLAETISTLCDIVELQNRIIHEQANLLNQTGIYCMEEKISNADQQMKRIFEP